MTLIFFWPGKTRCAYQYKGSKTSRFTLARSDAVIQTWQITLKIRLSTASNLILQNSTERRARKRPSPPSGSHLAGRRAVRRTGLAFQRLGSRPHRPDDLGDGSPRHPSRLLPNRRARAQQSTPLLKLGWTTGARGGSQKISDVEQLESPSARLARRLVLNDPSSLSVRHLRSATAERPFRKSGTDGSNPVPSSGESANHRSRAPTPPIRGG